MTCEVNGQIWKQSPCRQVPAPPTNSLVSAGGGCQRACVCVLCVCGRQAVIEEVLGGGGEDGEWRIDVGTRGIGRDLGFVLRPLCPLCLFAHEVGWQGSR